MMAIIMSKHFPGCSTSNMGSIQKYSEQAQIDNIIYAEKIKRA